MIIIFTTDKYGRFHHNLTNLSSELRKFLTYENEKLKGIDLPNAQPLLLLILLNHIKEHKESQYLVDPSEVLKAIDENLDQVQLLKELVLMETSTHSFIISCNYWIIKICQRLHGKRAQRQ